MSIFGKSNKPAKKKSAKKPASKSKSSASPASKNGRSKSASPSTKKRAQRRKAEESNSRSVNDFDIEDMGFDDDVVEEDYRPEPEPEIKPKKRPAKKPTSSQETAARELRESLDADEDAIDGKVQFYRESPKRGWKEPLIENGYKATVIMIPVFLLFSGYVVYQNHSLRNRLDSQIEETYNPSLRERNADLAKSAIYSYYNKDSVPPVSIARGIKWPGGNGSTDTSAESLNSDLQLGSGDSGQDANASVVGEEAEISAVVRNLSLEQSEVWYKNGTESEIRQNPAMERSLMQGLTFRGLFNGQPVHINVTLQTPGAKSPGEMTVADTIQPPILVSVPTVVAAPASVSGAPGSSDPGERNGEFEPVADVPETVQKTIQTWAESYASDDRQSLRGVVQDPQDRNYVGMQGGWIMKEGTAKTQWQYIRKSDDLLVVGVSFVTTQAVRGDKESDEPFITDNTQMMELLIDYSQRGTPAVIAWGVTGSAPHLSAYQNAIADGRVPSANNKPESTGTNSGGAEESESSSDSSSSPSSSSSSDPSETSSNEEESSDSELDFNDEDFY